MDPLQTAIAYHDRTKHHFNRFARSAGFMDWANQPNPFRWFEGAPGMRLPISRNHDSPPYGDLYRAGVIRPQPVTIRTIGEFFEYGLGFSAWKQLSGTRWALRCNPSSGNLHPTEGYLIAPALDGLNHAPGVYHYLSGDHALQQRCAFAAEVFEALVDGYPPGTFMVGLTSIHWREAWKYGERAYRYCQHDTGHALAALVLSAATLGWRVQMLTSPSDDDIAAILGLDRDADFADAEREDPDLLAIVVTNGADNFTECRIPAKVVTQIAAGAWNGQANRLSNDHVEWSVIDEVAQACRKPRTDIQQRHRPPAGPSAAIRPPHGGDGIPARQIVYQRRSAVEMDGHTEISRATFYQMLSRVTPQVGNCVWQAWPMPPRVHLGLFVHRVEDLDPGLYALIRNADRASCLMEQMKPDFEWAAPPECPENLPLYRLQAADARRAAGVVSCGQAIASDGVFSLGMIAGFEAPIREHGAWMYRRLFWETGMIGQVLYLEAEATGIRATGIGCFFDDPVHEIFGLSGHAFQSLYHFTVGGQLEDNRLTTLPGYDDERRGAVS